MMKSLECSPNFAPFAGLAAAGFCAPYVFPAAASIVHFSHYEERYLIIPICHTHDSLAACIDKRKVAVLFRSVCVNPRFRPDQVQ